MLTVTGPSESVAVASVLYAACFLLAYRNRGYYVLFAALLLLAAGVRGVQFAPALWLPVQLAFELRAVWLKS